MKINEDLPREIINGKLGYNQEKLTPINEIFRYEDYYFICDRTEYIGLMYIKGINIFYILTEDDGDWFISHNPEMIYRWQTKSLSTMLDKLSYYVYTMCDTKNDRKKDKFKLKEYFKNEKR